MYYRKVNYYETDKMGIVHHSNYIRWMEEARLDFLEKIGWSLFDIEKKNIVSPVVSVSCSYKKPVIFGETIGIKVTVSKVTSVKVVFSYEMLKEDGTVCTVGESSHCFTKENGSFLKLKTEAPDFYNKLMSYIEN